LAGEGRIAHCRPIERSGEQGARRGSDFGNALKFVGPVAASMNVSLDETVGTLADFAQNGILGEQAGTSLRGVLSSLTSPSKAATDELKALGVVTEDGASKLFDAQGKFKGLANLAGVLQEATKNLTQEERANALGKIFGNQQLTAANILIKDGEKGIRDFTTAVNDQGEARPSIAGKEGERRAGCGRNHRPRWRTSGGIRGGTHRQGSCG
jgi:TP901 family phage tail tape measure protein